MNVRTVLNLTPEAVETIEKHAPSINKRGQWTSMAITEYVRIMASANELDSEGGGILERIENRLVRIEEQLAALQKMQ